MSEFHEFGQGDVTIVEESMAYDGFFKLKQMKLTFRRFDGTESALIERELCVRGDAVGVLLYDPQHDCFAMVEQMRIGALGRDRSPWMLELVAGMLDKEGENCEEVARRETIEEAGLEIQTLEPMLRYFASPGGGTEFFTLYCGRVDLAGIEGGLFGLEEENEDIRLHVLPVDQVLAMLDDGIINNAMSVIALQWFQLHREKLDARWKDAALGKGEHV